MTLQEVLFVMFIYVHIHISATKLQSSHEGLSLLKMFGSSDKTPLVVVIKPTSGTEPPSDVYNFLLASDDEKTGKSNDESEGIMEEAKDLLYSYLRASPYDSHKEIQEKRALRAALRYRCVMVFSCIQKCTTWKPQCPEECEEKYDKEEVCKPKRGKTMPPSWLL